jgi:hypothetical protein
MHLMVRNCEGHIMISPAKWAAECFTVFQPGRNTISLASACCGKQKLQHHTKDHHSPHHKFSCQSTRNSISITTMAISKQQTILQMSSTRQGKQSQRTYDELNDIIGRGLQILDDFEASPEIDQNDETDSSNTSSQSSGPQRAIRFAPANKVLQIMTLEEYSDKELRRCWYSPEEKEKMNNSKDKIVARLEAGKKPRVDMTYRGLECWTTAGGQELDENIARSVNAIMDEQDRQWAYNDDDWNKISEISAAVTVESSKVARRVAMKDEKEARMAWEDSDDLSVSSSHSTMSEIVPVISSRKQLFDVLKRSSSHHAKRREGSTENASSEPESKDKRRKSKKSKKSKKTSKKSRRSCPDPPAPVKRSASQDASELLLKMVSAGRQMSSMKV